MFTPLLWHRCDRLIGKDDLWSWLEHPAKDQLLHIAARQKPDALQHPLTAHVIFGDHILGKGLRRRPVHPAMPAKGRAGIGFQHRVFGQVEIRNRAGLVPIFWDAGDLVVHRLTRRPSSGFSPVNLDPALIGTQEARNQISQRRLPVARHARALRRRPCNFARGRGVAGLAAVGTALRFGFSLGAAVR